MTTTIKIFMILARKTMSPNQCSRLGHEGRTWVLRQATKIRTLTKTPKFGRLSNS